jgi:hypothetical protein
MPGNSNPSSAAQPAPHSWDLEHWPVYVWPHTRSRARYVIRMFKRELIAAGALYRVGRQFVLLGAGYTRWLRLHGSQAARYDIAPNTSTAPGRG